MSRLAPAVAVRRRCGCHQSGLAVRERDLDPVPALTGNPRDVAPRDAVDSIS